MPAKCRCPEIEVGRMARDDYFEIAVKVEKIEY